MPFPHPVRLLLIQFQSDGNRGRVESRYAALALGWIDAGEHPGERGVALFAQRPDKEWSLTDCISFVVMREHGLSDALTADHHFEQAGFVPLLQ